jgi:hypothetical protein
LKRNTKSPVDTAGHLKVLETLDSAGHVSQRAVGETVGMAASRVNRIIDDDQSKHSIQREAPLGRRRPSATFRPMPLLS